MRSRGRVVMEGQWVTLTLGKENPISSRVDATMVALDIADLIEKAKKGKVIMRRIRGRELLLGQRLSRMSKLPVLGLPSFHLGGGFRRWQETRGAAEEGEITLWSGGGKRWWGDDEEAEPMEFAGLEYQARADQ